MPPNAPPPQTPAPPPYESGPPGQPQQPEKQKNTVGLIALIMAIIGFIFACIPGALIIGWILLPISFILGIVGVVLSGKKKGTSVAAIIVAVVGTIVGVIVFLVVLGGALDDAMSTDDVTAETSETTEADESPDGTEVDEEADADSPEADQEADADSPEADESEEGNGPEGARDNPFQIGESVSNDDWTVTLDDPYEANDVIADENEFNDPPEDGTEFWIVPVEATYNGADSGFPWVDIDVNFVSDDGNTYNTYEPGCGVVPDSLDDVAEMYTDATAEGNVCVQVPEGAPGLWSVAVGFGDRVFFSAN